MELCEIIAGSLNNTALFASILVAISTLIGAPYIVRAQNRKSLDQKADIKRLEKIEEDMECVKEKKANLIYVDDKIRAIHHRIEDERNFQIKLIEEIKSSQEVTQRGVEEIRHYIFSQKK